MSVDIESFFIGFQVGRRLGRTPKDRMPPEPTPENSYMISEIDEDSMITESGDYMVTE